MPSLGHLRLCVFAGLPASLLHHIGRFDCGFQREKNLPEASKLLQLVVFQHSWI